MITFKERVLGLIVTRFEVQYRLCHRMAVFKTLYVGKRISAKLTNLAHAKFFEFRVRMEGHAELVKSLNWMRDNSVDNILFETFSVTRPGSSNEIVRGRCSRL